MNRKNDRVSDASGADPLFPYVFGLILTFVFVIWVFDQHPKSREDVAQLIHWHQFIWFAGVVNVGAMLPQLIKIVRTKDVAAISPGMYWLYMVLQLAFSAQGFFTYDSMFQWCMGLSAFVSLGILISYYKYRQRA